MANPDIQRHILGPDETTSVEALSEDPDEFRLLVVTLEEARNNLINGNSGHVPVALEAGVIDENHTATMEGAMVVIEMRDTSVPRITNTLNPRYGEDFLESRHCPPATLESLLSKSFANIPNTVTFSPLEINQVPRAVAVLLKRDENGDFRDPETAMKILEWASKRGLPTVELPYVPVPDEPVRYSTYVDRNLQGCEIRLPVITMAINGKHFSYRERSDEGSNFAINGRREDARFMKPDELRLFLEQIHSTLRENPNFIPKDVMDSFTSRAAEYFDRNRREERRTPTTPEATAPEDRDAAGVEEETAPGLVDDELLRTLVNGCMRGYDRLIGGHGDDDVVVDDPLGKGTNGIFH